MEDSNVPGGSAPKARSRIGVWVRSGLTQFTLTPIGDHSSASAWVRLTIAALDEEYRLYPARPRVYELEV